MNTVKVFLEWGSLPRFTLVKRGLETVPALPLERFHRIVTAAVQGKYYSPHFTDEETEAWQV